MTPAPRATSERREHRAADAVDGAAGHRQRVDTVAEAQLHEPLRHAVAHARDERIDDARAGAPGDVEARHRVAVADRAVAAALGPAGVGQEADAPLAHPGALLAGGELHVGLGPARGPEVLRAIEARGALPVLPGQVIGVAHAHPALLGRVHQEDAAERPERLAAERRLGLLVDEHHALAGVDQLGGGDEPGEAGADDDRVGVHLQSLCKNIGGKGYWAAPFWAAPRSRASAGRSAAR